MLFRLVLVFAVLLISACSQISVTPVSGSLNNLAGYTDYRWGWPPLASSGRHDKDLLLQDQTLRRAVSRQMSAIGIATRPHEQSSELLVDYKLLFNPQQYADLDQPEGGWVWKRDSEGELQRSRVEQDAKIIVDRVTLQLTVYSGDKSKVLWDIEVSSQVDHNHPPRQMIAAINQMVEQLFKG